MHRAPPLRIRSRLRAVGRLAPPGVRTRVLAALALCRFALFFRRTARRWRSASSPPDEALWRAARAAWGPLGRAPRTAFLAAATDLVTAADGAVLECGSGLSTIALATRARALGVRFLSLEHDPARHARMCWALRLCGLRASVVRLVPLREFDGYAWYDLRRVRLPRWVSIVLCDGPGAAAAGGAFGLLPRLRGRLRYRARILVNNADRVEVQAVLRRWREAYEVRTLGVHGDDGSAALLEAP